MPVPRIEAPAVALVKVEAGRPACGVGGGMPVRDEVNVHVVFGPGQLSYRLFGT
jgi:hypothetical protein